VDSRSSKLEEAFRKITRANISKIDDDFIKDYSEKIEIHLKVRKDLKDMIILFFHRNYQIM